MVLQRADILKIGSISIGQEDTPTFHEWVWDVSGRMVRLFGDNPPSVMGWPIKELVQMAQFMGLVVHVN